ncbi:general secretion pathway protein GspE [Geomonas limicola]|uniref:General secretion pathway protein GspE n=1 Tax=Geomonas limicola TaxID=2740186 RepID=A0A6V8N4C9_9BACT|nr:general secretion pathway protein GspE [Geomonas limicola]GFO67408.1 general secretion pathway protein GspE [Geomonas limicola]
MAERLGEMLLQEGALTTTQLEEALSAQSIYGGRIGTNLVEMGLVSEEDLGRLLNQKLGVPCVTASSLESVPPAVIEALSPELAQRFRVVPVALEGRRLMVAMADPADFHAVEELGFATGLVIVPRVCPELRLSVALEHYYGIKRALRYIPMPEGARTVAARKALASLAGCAGSPSATAAGGNSASLAGGTGAHAAEVEGDDERSGAGAGFSVRPTVIDGGTASARRHGIEAVMEALSRRFVAATGEVEVVTVLMSYLAEEFDRAGFFSLKCGAAQWVQAVAEGANVSQFGGWLANLDRADLIKQVLFEKEPYLGMLSERAPEERIQAKIGGRPGCPVLLLPLVVEGTSIAFLMVEDEKGRLAPGLFDLRRVVAKAELAFEMLGLKKRICIV